MPTQVNIPGLGTVNFPDEMTPEQIQAEAQNLYERQQGIVAEAQTTKSGGGLFETSGKDLRRFFNPTQFANLLSLEPGKEVEAGAIPSGVGLLGEMVGGALTRGSRSGRIVGEAVGSGLGELGNQFLGVTEDDPMQVGLAVAASPLMRGAMAGGRELKRWLAPQLPGAGAALRSLAREEALAVPKTLLPEIPSDKLFAELATENPQIPLGPIRDAARQVGKSKSMLATPGQAQAASADQLAGVRAIAQRIEKVQSQVPGSDTIDFQTVHATMKDLNALIASAKANRGPEFGQLMQLKRGFWEALESIPESAKPGKPHSLGSFDDLYGFMWKDVPVSTTGVYAKLKQANMAMRQEIAHDTLDEIVFKNFDQFLEGTADLNSTAARAMNQLQKALRDDEFLAASFPKGSVDKIMATFDRIRKLPVRGAPPGADAGSKLIWQRGGIGGGLGTAVGALIGGPAGGVIGGGLGAAAGIGGSALIANSLKTDKGRQLLIKMLEAPGGFNYPKMAVLAQFLRAQSAEVPKREFAEAMRDPAKSPEEKTQAMIEQGEARQAIQQILQQVY